MGKSIESQKGSFGRCQNKPQERVKGLQSLVPTAKVKYCNMPKSPAIKRQKHVTFIVVFSRKQAGDQDENMWKAVMGTRLFPEVEQAGVRHGRDVV